MVKGAGADGNGYTLLVDDHGGERRISGTHVLVATGRRANVEVSGSIPLRSTTRFTANPDP